MRSGFPVGSWTTANFRNVYPVSQLTFCLTVREQNWFTTRWYSLNYADKVSIAAVRASSNLLLSPWFHLILITNTIFKYEKYICLVAVPHLPVAEKQVALTPGRQHIWANSTQFYNTQRLSSANRKSAIFELAHLKHLRISDLQINQRKFVNLKIADSHTSKICVFAVADWA